jgi:indole-3-glycerol phosphate synthase
MAAILDQIISAKHLEVAGRKVKSPSRAFEKSPDFIRRPLSLRNALLRDDSDGIIAEFKRRSPSKGVINASGSVQRTTMGYVRAGASALSILTDEEFFGGSLSDLLEAREFNECPILRKEFIVDEYQILEAKSIGADAILLIASVLDAKTMKAFCGLAHSLGLEVLMEIHNEEEFRLHENAQVDMIGINNRDLQTFKVDLDTSRRLSSLLPKSSVKISESGIESPEAIVDLMHEGFSGFLIGQFFMEKPVPEEAAADFIRELRLLKLSVPKT